MTIDRSSSGFVRCVVAIGLGLIVLGPSVRAQEPVPVALDDILQRLDDNLRKYDAGVPSFYCSEHDLSEVQPGADMSGYRRSVADSTFRVKRASDPGQPVQLEESRTVNAIDGKATSGDDAKMDSLLAVFGIFSGALKLVTTQSKACFQYRVHAPRKGHDGDGIVIDFASLPEKERGADCQYLEKTAGKATVDPASMQIVHMDTKISNHEILPGIRGTWEWSIDYSRIVLNGKTFWLPSQIRSTAVTEPPDRIADSTPTNYNATRGTAAYDNKVPSANVMTKGPMTYHLLEKFTDYHLLTVESRIVPVAGDDAKKP